MAVIQYDDYLSLLGQNAAANRHHPGSAHAQQLSQEVAIQRVVRFVKRLEKDGPALTEASRHRLAAELVKTSG